MTLHALVSWLPHFLPDIHTSIIPKLSPDVQKISQKCLNLCWDLFAVKIWDLHMNKHFSSDFSQIWPWLVTITLQHYSLTVCQQWFHIFYLINKFKEKSEARLIISDKHVKSPEVQKSNRYAIELDFSLSSHWISLYELFDLQYHCYCYYYSVFRTKKTS